MKSCLSVEQKVQNVHAGAGLAAVELRVAALNAGDSGKFLILDIEDFGEIAAGGLDLIGSIAGAAAFWADISFLFHKVHPFFLLISGYGKAFDVQLVPGMNPRLFPGGADLLFHGVDAVQIRQKHGAAAAVFHNNAVFFWVQL